MEAQLITNLPSNWQRCLLWFVRPQAEPVDGALSEIVYYFLLNFFFSKIPMGLFEKSIKFFSIIKKFK